jgi:hypothetical protein
MPKVSEFRWKEMFNNSNGKTSGMLFVCTIACFNSAMTFSTSAIIVFGSSIYGALFHVPLGDIMSPDITMLLRDVMFQSIAMFGLGATGLGVRRFTTDKPITDDSAKIEGNA